MPGGAESALGIGAFQESFQSIAIPSRRILFLHGQSHEN
jgi:hypothetical protein